MFAQAYRLRKSHEIEQLVRFGRRFSTPHWRAYYDLPGEKSGTSLNRLANQKPRVTVVVGKKIAKGAVTRNRIKRRTRAALKGLPLPLGIRLAVFPNLKLLNLPFTVIQEEFSSFIEHLNQ